MAIFGGGGVNVFVVFWGQWLLKCKANICQEYCAFMPQIPKINFVRIKNIKYFQKKQKTYRSLQIAWSLKLGAYTGRSIDISYQADGYMNFFLENIHYVKCCKKIFFVCFPPGFPGTKLNKKMHIKMTTFQNNEGWAGRSK